MTQALEVAGALLILLAYVFVQRGWRSPFSRLVLAMNCLGAALLAVLAAQTRQWGFLLLEGTWALISLQGLLSPKKEESR